MPDTPGSPVGLHRVIAPAGVLPQAAQQLDARPELWPDEVRISVERLNLDAASYRQLAEAHAGDGEAVKQAVLRIVGERGKMQNPVTGSGGMLVGTVDEVGPESPLGVRKGDRVATLVSLTLTPLQITDGLARWDGRSEQVPAEGHAILFARSIVAKLPDDLVPELSLAVMDVCGAPALTARVVREYVDKGTKPVVSVIGGAGKSGSLSLAAARDAGAARTIGIVPFQAEADKLDKAGLADVVALADARDPVALANAVAGAMEEAGAGALEQTGDSQVGRGGAGEAADITVVCVDVPGCEHGAVLSTKAGGTVIFFSMATSFSAAALGAEGLAADVTMLVGNGYVPGHAEYALKLLRDEPGVRGLFEGRLAED
ncbi:hypothetical protein [Kribbella catacumbae]|uniref:L-erythro-3,5-diaminohexanoate dehydrogenase n=1 Tax=Kribbella catacumbae TaxID=460086 RepID=UPI00037165B9|nr:hypothetical protein [Kribbella catacumbae]